MSVLSSYVAGEVYDRIKAYVTSRSFGWVLPGGISYRCFPADSGRTRQPDVSFIALSRYDAHRAVVEEHCSVVPDLAVDVVSPGDLAYQVDRGVEEWLTVGVRLMWVVHPKTRRIYAYQPGGGYTLFREHDTLTADPVLPGFAYPAADLFRLPGGGVAAGVSPSPPPRP